MESDEDRKSHDSSFMETEKDRNSVGTFQHKARLFKGLEQSEIEKPAIGESEFTSTIRGAFNQVSSIVEAHEFRFNKGKNKKKNNKSRTNMVF